MSTSVAGYSAASDLIDLDVQCLTGEALTLQVAVTTLGKAVRRLISEQQKHVRKAEGSLCIMKLHSLY